MKWTKRKLTDTFKPDTTVGDLAVCALLVFAIGIIVGHMLFWR